MHDGCALPLGLPWIAMLCTTAVDRYEARIDDPVAALEELINGPADLWVRHTPQQTATVRGVVWFDGGRSGGHDVTEWCMVLVDDKAEVFDCTVSQLTTASFCRFVTVKAKCNAAGITQVVGPILRAMVDLGMYGAVHRRTGMRITVDVDEVVADMDALIQLVGKEVGTKARCPWCDSVLKAAGEDRGQSGVWGDMHTGCSGGRQSRPYGEHMRKWKQVVLPMRRQGELKLVNGAWTSRDGGTFRKCTDGMGAERPVLYRYRRVLSSQPGRWHTDRVCAADWSSKDKERPHAGVGMASYITPDIGHEPESVEWDALEGTEEEHQYAQLWLDKLVLLPDELHITERLVEGWRDLADQLAVSNGSRKQGTWLFRHAWAASARRKVFKRNWRTYHLRLALSANMATGTLDQCIPAVLMKWGRALSGLVMYMKHDPDKAPPACAEVPTGVFAEVYGHLSACWLIFVVWLTANAVFPTTLARRLHVHALWQLLAAVVRVPWLTSRSCEWGEATFYKERMAKHVAESEARPRMESCTAACVLAALDSHPG